MAPSPLTRRRLEPIAAAWLRQARGFGIWSSAGPVLVWPVDCSQAQPDVMVPIPRIEGGFHLGLLGADADAAHPQLIGDAALLGELAAAESDLGAITAELADQQDQMLALYDLSRATGRQLDVDRLIATLVTEARALLKADAAFVLMIEEGGQSFATEPAGGVSEAVARLLAADGWRNGRSLVVHRAGDGSHVLITPVRLTEGARAVIGAVRSAAVFTAADLKLSDAIAEQASSQIGNAVMHRDALERAKLQVEMQLASTVQHQLLPTQEPDVPGLDLYAASRPASVVGGDFYDWMDLGSGRVAVTCGDVSGKGVAAALVMSMTRTALRSALLSAVDQRTSSVLARATRSLYDDLTRLSMFVTVFMGCYDADSSRVQFISAGHAGMIYRPAGGAATLLDATDAPIGMLDTTTAEERELCLGPGDLLVIASDGYYEARNGAGEQYGFERMMQDVDDSADRPLDQLWAHLHDRVGRFRAAAAQDDDQTLLIMRGTER